MKRIKQIGPLLLAVAVIVAVILVLENPFSGGASEGSSQDEVLVFDAPELENVSQLVSKEDAEASQENLVPAALPQNDATPTKDREGASPTPREEGSATAEPKPATPKPSPPPKVAEGPVAPELAGIKAWINAEPLKLSDLRGKVVLVDFWTYTCVNCIRTFPYLKLWHSKYVDDGLVIVGVHTPEFAFEKKPENVRQAVKEYGLAWPVVLDNDYATWQAYRNRYWPAKYLIDKDGVIRYTHFGEGRYAETESKIRELLEESGADLSRLEINLPADQEYDPAYTDNPLADPPTRELYAGWERGYRAATVWPGGYVKNSEYYSNPDAVVDYVDPEEYQASKLYLHGQWHNGPESLTHARETTGFEDYVFLRFTARSVNAVINPEGKGSGPFKVLVTVDGEPLTEENKGDDVVIEADGRSFIHVEEPRMYSIVQVPVYGTYDLKLSSNSPRFAIFAYTFGVYVSGI